jgi:hypothetical protein
MTPIAPLKTCLTWQVSLSFPGSNANSNWKGSHDGTSISNSAPFGVRFRMTQGNFGRPDILIQPCKLVFRRPNWRRSTTISPFLRILRHNPHLNFLCPKKVIWSRILRGGRKFDVRQVRISRRKPGKSLLAARDFNHGSFALNAPAQSAALEWPDERGGKSR